MKRLKVVFVALLLVFSAAGHAGAQLQQYSFTGQITALDDPGGVLGGTVSPGTPFSGTCAYNLSTPDTGPPPVVDTGIGYYYVYKESWYAHVPPLGFDGITVSLGAFVFRTDPGQGYLVDMTYDYWMQEEPGPEGPLMREEYTYAWSMLGPALGSVSVGGDPRLNLRYSECGWGSGPGPWLSDIRACQVEDAALFLSDEASGFLLQGSVTGATRNGNSQGSPIIPPAQPPEPLPPPPIDPDFRDWLDEWLRLEQEEWDRFMETIWRFDDVPGEAWFDPILASGYVYTTDGQSAFMAVELPTGVEPGGDQLFTISDDVNGSVTLPEGSRYEFPTPVEGFVITGIEPPVDGEDPLAFPTYLEFDQATGSFSMIPIPEPATLSLLALGSLLLVRRRAR